MDGCTDSIMLAVRYYDEGDAAHAALREKAKRECGIVGGPAGVLTVYFEAGAGTEKGV